MTFYKCTLDFTDVFLQHLEQGSLRRGGGQWGHFLGRSEHPEGSRWRFEIVVCCEGFARIQLRLENSIKSLYEGVVNNPDSNFRPTPRSRRSSSQFLRPQVTGVTAGTSLSSDKLPLILFRPPHDTR